MRLAVRAIIQNERQLLVMLRQKEGASYYTLVGGRVNDGETPEEALHREVKEETGLTITNQRLVYSESHPEPYNEQLIYLCDIAPQDSVALSIDSEEAYLNTIGTNLHEPAWVNKSLFAKLPFRTPQLQTAIVKAMKKGFPKQPEQL